MLLPLTCFGSNSSKTRCKLHDTNTEMFGNTGGGYYGNNQNNGGIWRLPLFIAFYIVFLILGAAIFSAIEGPQEMQKVKSLKQMRADFLEEYPCVPDETSKKLISRGTEFIALHSF
ncbi:potassium channel subfamily K member 1-like [Chrysoperla carnea]|uniref:potassium channel subfamily K member 1-like n=1 Tax=Chrysoperla carnea TaxID=189513 RepID=UPI001D07B658|nr:potassium channel subfamily K member 1-like [Chrysoperla carnea]